MCDEAVRMVNLARRCGTLRLRNAGFSDYPFITASLFKLVIKSSDQAFGSIIPAAAKVSAQNMAGSQLAGLDIGWTDLAFPDPRLVGGEFAGITVEIKRRQLNQFLSLLFVGFGGEPTLVKPNRTINMQSAARMNSPKIAHQCRAPVPSG